MWRIAGSTGSVGLEIAAYIGLCYLGGQWLDRRFGTGPWFEWSGLVVGVGAAINALIRLTRAYKKSLKTEDAAPPDKPRA